ncbi:hypothetical protein JJJ17_10950 [Paracoccus caeni]|uniref:Uncharacterized protein n=1 Tax=Paracoccus caeni TaxID=657651 RepID=A0A934SFH3_9RHOB|nr:hypothetical protein [Paracoccus caeni]MBK4216444.1 hypothetical protein [Paracoccus caeni]
MNANQLINMLMRMVTQRLMNWGINKGVGQMSRRGGKQASGRQVQQNSKRIRQAINMIRRMGR